MKQSSILNFFSSGKKRTREDFDSQQQKENQKNIVNQIQILPTQINDKKIEIISSQTDNPDKQDPQSVNDNEDYFSGFKHPRGQLSRRKKVIIDSDTEEQVSPQKLNTQKTQKSVRFTGNSPQEDYEPQDEQEEDEEDDYKPKKKSQGPIKKQVSTPQFGSKKSEQKSQGDGRAGLEGLKDTTPHWALPENARDKQMRKRDHPNYDPSTLYIPPEELKKLTTCMQQYWTIKSDNFDKVVLFKLGKFYELFYEDALITNKELELNWMGEKMHTGFPERALDKMATRLVEKGYKVAIAEQTETPQEMEKRLRQKQGPKCIQRELIQVMTKGTYDTSQEGNYDPRYLVCLKNFKNYFSLCILEHNTNLITIIFLDDDSNYTQFKTLMCQIKPQEVVFDPIQVNSDVKKILKSGYLVPQLSPFQNKKNEWNRAMAIAFYQNQFQDKSKYPPLILDLIQNQNEKNDIILETLSGLFNYLKSLLIYEEVIATARYQMFEEGILSKSLQTNMILDSQALQHLEILEPSSGFYSNKQGCDGSLFSYVNKTKTAFGYRMLKKWVCSPLMDIDQINERLNALEDLENICEKRDAFQKGLAKMPDLQKMCGRIYKYQIKQAKKNIVYFEDFSTIHLKEFKSLLENFVAAYKLILDSFQNESFTSQRLQNLVLSEEKGGLLPEIEELINTFDSLIEWKDNRPHPQQGLVEEYDQALEYSIVCQEKLNIYLKTIQKRFDDKSIKFSTKYELEIHETLVSGNKKPREFEFTSKSGKYQRFLTNELKGLIREYEDAQEQEKKELKSICVHIFSQFYQMHKTWDQFILVLAELDCLCSLSLLSFTLADGVMTRPKIVSTDHPFIFLKQARHPCLSALGLKFIPNDVSLGDVNQTGKYQDQKTLMLLTGPNMGGKSTTLRMISICTILGQMGCYVPAKEASFSVVDRIFTRLGASDKLMEGKSTFYIEMEETFNTVSKGTINSLVIMDELGRGTSTHDGYSIAYGIIRYLAENLKCRSLFATHYHSLIDEFRLYHQIDFYHMDCFVDNKAGRVVFLYKLKKEEFQQSFAMNVAKIVGIEQSIIDLAEIKSNEFEQKLREQTKLNINKQFGQIIMQIENQNLDQFIKVLDQLNLQ